MDNEIEETYNQEETDVQEETVQEETVQEETVQEETVQEETVQEYNGLSLAVTETFVLNTFEITQIIVTPHKCASIYISIIGSNGKHYDRVVYIEGKNYDEWETDNFLYSYVQKNISNIF